MEAQQQQQPSPVVYVVQVPQPVGEYSPSSGESGGSGASEQQDSENGLETAENAPRAGLDRPEPAKKLPGDLRERYICAFEVPVDELKGFGARRGPKDA